MNNNKIGKLQQQERSLAYKMLTPTIISVFAIILFPLCLNIWLSFKSVQLKDLKSPTLQVSERIKSEPKTLNDPLVLIYSVRNSSREKAIASSGFTDIIPSKMQYAGNLDICTQKGNILTCNLGDVDQGFKERYAIEFFVNSIDPNLWKNVRFSKPEAFGKGKNALIFGAFTLDNFKAVLGARDFWPMVKATLAYTFFGTFGAIFLGLVVALILNREFKGRQIARGLFLFPYVAPVIAVAFTWVFILDPLSGPVNILLMEWGLIKDPINFVGTETAKISLFGLSFSLPIALTTVILFEIWRYFPLSFLFILARLQALPQDLNEAASVDGATPFQRFFYITLPQLMGIVSTLFLIRFIWTFNKFDDIFLMTGGGAGTRTLTVQVYELGFAQNDIGAGTAAATLMFLCLIIFIFIYFKTTPKEEI